MDAANPQQNEQTKIDLKKSQPYYLGLDVGTNSVGWAITDTEYRIIRKSGRSMWGVRLFAEAKTAADRRMFRTARRRRKRAKTRIKLLQEFFAQAINVVDPGFFQRLKDSFFYPDDKTINQKNTLFNDEGYHDQTHFESFPTIYHLRQALMSNTSPHDVRLVYLACHHIMKNRGNFLYNGSEINTTGQYNQSYQELLDVAETYDFELWPTSCNSDVRAILLNTHMSGRDKERALNSLNEGLSQSAKEISKLLVGNTGRLDILLDNEDLKEHELNKLCFEDDYESVRDSIEATIGPSVELLDAAHGLYSAALLQKILGGYSGEDSHSISEARIAIYEKHSHDLAVLKSVIRGIDQSNEARSANSLYASMFRRNVKNHNNYVAYSGHTDSDDTDSPISRCSRSDFYKYTKDLFKNYASQPNVEEILKDIEFGTFMPKILSSGNGIVPQQLHAQELKKILTNASNYLDFLNDDVIQKIMQVFSFKIPYYIGPLDDRSPLAWIVRKSNVSIRPWNYSDVVDVPKTAEKFVRNLTNKCTYLIGEDVLPKNSLLYSEYQVRNAINVLTVDGERLDAQTRTSLYQDLFVDRRKSGRITRKRVISALRNCGISATDATLGGMDLEIPAQLKSFIDFSRNGLLEIVTIPEAEAIIEKITCFPDGGEIVEQWLIKRFGGRLTSAMRELIRSFKYKDWGTLSRRLLTGIWHTFPDQRRMSIIELMRDQAVNLMELLSKDKYSFEAQIESANKALSPNAASFTAESLKDLRLAPPARKSIWQTLRICKELFSIMGGYPEKIFIEMARGEEEKTRKPSRKKHLAELYQQCKVDAHDWTSDRASLSRKQNLVQRNWINEINTHGEDAFKSKKLFLYYLQRGRCMYSAEPITLNDLFDQSKYDIDHIFPRSQTKDDSMNNLVLVKQELNRDKSDEHLSMGIQERCRIFWRSLLEQGLLSQEKYNRLIRPEGLTPDELEKFIARQLVVTRQSTKILASLLKTITGSPNIIYVKAELASDFRYRDGTRADALTQFYFPKVRDLNDLHHAKDAYLNIVVGNVYDTKFTRNFKQYLQSSPARSYNLVKFYDHPVRQGNQVAWLPGEHGTISTVKKMMHRNNIMVTYESARQTGGFFDQMIVKKGLGQYPIKSSEQKSALSIKRYGGYNKVSGSHFCLITHEKNKKQMRTLVSLPILLGISGFSENAACEYLQEQGYINPRIIAPEIRYGSIIVKNSVSYRIIAKTGEGIKCSSTIQPIYTTEAEVLFKHFERCLLHPEREPDVSDQTLLDCFHMLSARFRQSPFNSISALAEQGNKLVESVDAFTALDVRNKLKNIFRILNLLRGGATLTDMSDLYSKPGQAKSGTQSGMVKISANFQENDIVQIMNQSVTGFYQNYVRL